MPHTSSSFVILEQVDSTNNYAMAKVHAGMAKHGDCWFTNHQTEGKGQRGKVWISGPGDSIALSIVFNPKHLSILNPFQLSTAVALGLWDFYSEQAGQETFIKWPNDIYWRDRKAAGILIENKYSGKDWKWAVVGIGVNINQTEFDASLANPVSLKQITGKMFDTVVLARKLHDKVLQRTTALFTNPYPPMLAEYNRHLYKTGQAVKLKKDNMVFKTVVQGVSAQGHLLTKDVIEKQFEFGEVEWVIK